MKYLISWVLLLLILPRGSPQLEGPGNPKDLSGKKEVETKHNQDKIEGGGGLGRLVRKEEKRKENLHGLQEKKQKENITHARQQHRYLFFSTGNFLFVYDRMYEEVVREINIQQEVHGEARQRSGKDVQRKRSQKKNKKEFSGAKKEISEWQKKEHAELPHFCCADDPHVHGAPEIVHAGNEGEKEITGEKEKTKKTNKEISSVRMLRNLMTEKTGEVYISVAKHPSVHLMPTHLVTTEIRLAVEYLYLDDMTVVLLYDEKVTKMHNEHQQRECIKRRIKTVVKKSPLRNCESVVFRGFSQIRLKYRPSRIYMLQEVSGYFYLSEIFVGGIEEEKGLLIDRALQILTSLAFGVLLVFLVLPFLLRKYFREKTAIETKKERAFGVLFWGLLFGHRKVLVLVLNKASKKDLAVLSLIKWQRTKEAEKSGNILHVEETRKEARIAYAQDILPLSCISSLSIEKKHRILADIFRCLEDLCSQQTNIPEIAPSDAFFNRITYEVSLLPGASTDTTRYQDSERNPEKTVVREFSRAFRNAPDQDPGILDAAEKRDEVIFSAVSLFYFVYTNENLQDLFRARNITYGKKSEALRALARIRYANNPRFLIDRYSRMEIEMLDCMSVFADTQVMSFSAVAMHPFFWTLTQRFEFLALLSDYIFDHPAERIIEDSRVLQATELDYSQWDVYIDLGAFEALTRSGRYYYNTKTIRDLLRMIRNNGRHFQSIPETATEYLGHSLLEYTEYFIEKYPYLVLFGHIIATEKNLFAKNVFREIWG